MMVSEGSGLKLYQSPFLPFLQILNESYSLVMAQHGATVLIRKSNLVQDNIVIS